MKHKKILSEMPLFDGIIIDEYPYEIKKYDAGMMMYQSGDLSLTLDIILDGEAVIQHINYEGQLITLTSFKKGDTIGGNRIFSNNNKFPMTITAVQPTLLLRLHKQVVIQLCQTSESFLVQFLQDLANKSDLLSKRFKSQTFMSIEDKIVLFLNKMAETSNTNTFNLPFSKKEWAEKMGVQRTSLSRALQKMKKNGELDFKNKSFTIYNIKKMNE